MTRQLAVLALLLSVFCSTARADSWAPVRAWLHTREVHDLQIWDNALWTASTGGIERYDLDSLRRSQLLGTAEGLDDLNVLALELRANQLWARTANSECQLLREVTGTKLRCTASTSTLPSPRAAHGSLGGSAISVELRAGERLFTATRGAGVWTRAANTPASQARALTPAHQICTNHVQALAQFAGELWLGGFRDGLCVRRGAGFETIATPFRLINALLATSQGLFVAANEGLFRTRDGSTFERVALLSKTAERGVNGLALTGDTLWVTTASALYRLSLAGGAVQGQWMPGGSTAIQGLSAHGEQLWLASEDRGALRIRAGQVESFDALRGLDSSWVLDVLVEADGTAYAATLRHGLFVIEPGGQVRKLPLASNWLLRLAHAAGELWVGTQDGLILVQRGGAEPELLLPGHCVHSLLTFEDTLWVGTESGTFELSSRPTSLAAR